MIVGDNVLCAELSADLAKVSFMMKTSSMVEFVSARRFGQEGGSPIINTEYAPVALAVLRTRASGL